MPQLNNPREEALRAVFSLVANKTVAVNPRPADTLSAPRSHQLPVGMDSEGYLRREGIPGLDK